jgi:nitrogen fixation NifU-like protein
MYSERLLELFNTPRHAGKLEEATHFGEAGTPGQGPYLRLRLRVEAGIVEQARFKTYGCPAVIACGEALCQLVEGRPLAKIGLVTAARIEECVGGVPPEKSHCPPLAAAAWSALGPEVLSEGQPS